MSDPRAARHHNLTEGKAMNEPETIPWTVRARRTRLEAVERLDEAEAAREAGDLNTVLALSVLAVGKLLSADQMDDFGYEEDRSCPNCLGTAVLVFECEDLLCAVETGAPAGVVHVHRRPCENPVHEPVSA
ncbi:hypothetical protein ACFC1T_08750 [Kitasatospora sp. NPDC056076]|uniref:hypothetical protein n=1 Tax=Kitasatospora sp. NPDC056076 TaxID=3345703 RepID=UPI0035E2B2B7